MKEKLIIRNFGPIKNVELELGRFNVLIGEQATGKSTVSKLLSVCRDFSYIVNTTTSLIEDYSSFQTGLENNGLNEFAKENSYIYYQCKHYALTAQVNDEYINYYENRASEESLEYLLQDYKKVLFSEIKPLSKEFEFLIGELEKLKPNLFSQSLLNSRWKAPTSFFQNDVARIMDNPFYLPAERGLQSIFSLGKNSIQNIADSLFNQLSEMDLAARDFKSDTQIEPLNITYKNIDGKGFIRKNNEKDFYSLYNAASGYQSAIPVVLSIKYYEKRNKTKTFIVEEPELNLFPKAQNELVKFMADKTLNYGNSIFLNTHSPYILTSLNNLMYAYQLGKDNPEKVQEVVEKKYWLNPNEVSAYMMLPDGICENIFDREEAMIHAEKIDSISRILNEEFDKLINIELGIIKPKEASWQD